MFPIALNLEALPILLIGAGEAFEKRKAQLEALGAASLACHPCESRDPDIVKKELDASPRWHDSRVVMVAGLDRSISEMIAADARAAGKLVNVEDVNDLCDFYFMSLVQRGELTIAVSTNGASPTVAKRVRDYIARRFGEEWAGILAEMKQHRLGLRAEGKTMKEVMVTSDALIEQKGWLDCRRCQLNQTPQQVRGDK